MNPGDGDTTTRTMAASTKARVQKHRAKLRGQYVGRLEVWIGRTVIQNVRKVAKRRKVQMWVAVQEALEAYVTGHAACDGRPEPV